MGSFQENKKFIPQAAPWVKRVSVSATSRRYLPFRFARCARSCSVWRAKWWMNYSWYSWLLLQANKHLCATGLPEPFHETSGHAPALGLLAFRTVFPDPAALQLQSGLITCRNWIGNPITPMHPTLLVAEEAEKRTRALEGYASGEAEELCVVPLSRGSFLWLLCCAVDRKNLCWRTKHAIVKVNVLCTTCTLLQLLEGHSEWNRQLQRREHVFMIKAWAQLWGTKWFPCLCHRFPVWFKSLCTHGC